MHPGSQGLQQRACMHGWKEVKKKIVWGVPVLLCPQPCLAYSPCCYVHACALLSVRHTMQAVSYSSQSCTCTHPLHWPGAVFCVRLCGAVVLRPARRGDKEIKALPPVRAAPRTIQRLEAVLIVILSACRAEQQKAFSFLCWHSSDS
jgi:hypothetical protein